VTDIQVRHSDAERGIPASSTVYRPSHRHRPSLARWSPWLKVESRTTWSRPPSQTSWPRFPWSVFWAMASQETSWAATNPTGGPC